MCSVNVWRNGVPIPLRWAVITCSLPNLVNKSLHYFFVVSSFIAWNRCQRWHVDKLHLLSYTPHRLANRTYVHINIATNAAGKLHRASHYGVHGSAHWTSPPAPETWSMRGYERCTSDVCTAWTNAIGQCLHTQKQFAMGRNLTRTCRGRKGLVNHTIKCEALDGQRHPAGDDLHCPVLVVCSEEHSYGGER